MYRQRDHPRSRGVYVHARFSGVEEWGSSPLARGLRLCFLRISLGGRIIPARAGFTLTRVSPFCLLWDHPRSRGVYPHLLVKGGASSGSSPLARGLLSEFFGLPPATGIIPARAGFTGYPPRLRCTGRDHPRSRGVYWSEDFACCTGLGSSPLARGLQRFLELDIRIGGIIPARAGFTPPARRVGSPIGDHPRSRGVYDPRIEIGDLLAGSSPLARGLPARRREGGPGDGIIPARAGFTTKGSGGVVEAQGSSPLARGLLRQGLEIT